jgi:hypothetical protein
MPIAVLALIYRMYFSGKIIAFSIVSWEKAL